MDHDINLYYSNPCANNCNNSCSLDSSFEKMPRIQKDFLMLYV